ncbi:hypothetical protein ZIOFF_030277 [Zingiber officinale]|uniref:Uncharacterized protein n=1 Tax=Zingiber officinale TaxID=94328 RepID=A0A8J5GXV9_ZINOF|nr:hypothetical protein ZIOFF_030277 [Zingiber officinale]
MMLSVIVMKLDPTTGIIPSLNVAFGLLDFFIKLWTKVLEHIGVLHVPFTRQENVVIQTYIVTAYGLAFSGGYGNYLLGMSLKIAGQTKEANDPLNIKDPKLGWMIVCRQFVGLFSVTPLRKIMIIDYKLIYPSGTETAYLINGFHTPQGENLAKAKAAAFGPTVASGLICGDGVWSLPQAVLALLKVKPPICMKFLSRPMNERYFICDICLASLMEVIFREGKALAVVELYAKGGVAVPDYYKPTMSLDIDIDIGIRAKGGESHGIVPHSPPICHLFLYSYIS